MYESRTLVGLPMISRYRCSGCGTKFDLFSSFGEIFAYVVGAALPLIVLVLPDKKFADPSDRWTIFALTSALGAALIMLGVRSRRNATANPLMP